MVSGCCGSASCACKITGGPGITITGSGTANDPFVLSTDLKITAGSNSQFTLAQTGSGTQEDPWVLQVVYSPTATLAALPDVADTTPSNGQVLTWNTATAKWIPAAGTTAPVGAVQHDASLAGDGSVVDPLRVVGNEGRFITVSGAGVGMNDAGVNSLVRHFADTAERTAAVPAPILGTVSMLDSTPGRLEFWDGTAWAPMSGASDLDATGQFLNLSGAYTNQRLTHVIRQVTVTTDALGVFDALSAADLAGRIGVLSVVLQETGSLAWKAVLTAAVDRVTGVAYRLSDGTVLAGQAVTGIVDAWTY